MSSRREDDLLDPRAWLAWGAAASLPPLLGRNPFPLIAVALIVVGTRAVWSARAPQLAGWRGIVRLTLLFAMIGVVFNVLTVRGGDRVIATIPNAIPVLGGAVTANALVFGVLSGVALVTLVLIGSTVSAMIDWATAIRLLPGRLTTAAVAGSVAFAFIPAMGAALCEVREARASRGYRTRGARDLAALAAPLLTGGLERALVTAEALESRGFGAPPVGGRSRRESRPMLAMVGLGVMVLAVYWLATGTGVASMALFGVGGAALVISFTFRGDGAIGRTRYRASRLARADWVVIGGAAVAGAATIVATAWDPAAIRYEPYPRLTVPAVSIGVILGQVGLLAAMLAAPGDQSPAAEDFDARERAAVTSEPRWDRP